MNKFSQLNLTANTLDAIRKLHFKKMTLIQQKVIPLNLKKQNLIVQSQTGTGKTHAFLLPIFNDLQIKQGLDTLIISPTRELAMQIYEMTKELNLLTNKKAKISLFIGGKDKSQNIKSLINIPNIIIGTPGRITDLVVQEQKINLGQLNHFIIDEIDMIFELSFLEHIMTISRQVNKKAQFAVYSATISQGVKFFLSKYLKNAVIININPYQKTNINITHILLKTKHQEKIVVLKQLLSILDPYLAIIFVNKKSDIDYIVKALKNHSKDVGFLHGGLEQRQRKQMIKKIKTIKFKYIVATDIAARGIDIEGVSHIISLDVPYDLNYYIHRSGRCGRKNLKGTSILFYDNDNQEAVAKLQKKGLKFSLYQLKKEQFVPVNIKPRKNKQKSEVEIDILQVITSTKAKVKKSGVKPGYRKKMKIKINKIKQKNVRKHIKANIKQMQKQKAKEKNIRLMNIDK